MQHDTSPFVIKIAGKTVQVQCASLVLWYSRKLYIQFYPCFTRFEARLFLCEAIEFMEGACGRCMNDNTSVVVVAGTGPDAVIAPEIEKLGNLFGTRFQAHAVNHPERKGQVEKQFFYVGCNFLAGRIFTSWEDLNRQARQWCVTVANEKVKRILGMSPNAAHVLEKPHLRALPAYIPPVYDSFFRVVDAQGWVHLASNLYSVHYRFAGRKVEVLKLRDEVRIMADHTEVARHRRVIDQRNQRVLIPGHHDALPYACKKRAPLPEETLLRSDHTLLDRYVSALKQRLRGRGLVQLRRLLDLQRTYPREAFLYAIERALNFRLYDLSRLESVILTYLRGSYFEQ